MSIVELAIGKLAIDSALQPRVGGIDPDHVRELQNELESCPPLRVVRRGDKYLLIDGFHRFAAAQNLNKETVTVEILEPETEDDLFALAFSLNATHGRPLSLTDRRAYAARLLQTHPDWSDREIGRRCGLVQPTVAKVRQELEHKASIPVTKERVGRDGQSYSVQPKEPAKSTGLLDVINAIVSPGQRAHQRQLVHYLSKLADVLEEQEKLKGFETFDDAAIACRAVLGDKGAFQLAERIGWSSRNIWEIAKTLGYQEESAS